MLIRGPLPWWRRAGAALAAVAATALLAAPAAAEDSGATPTSTEAAANANIGPQTAGTVLCTVNNSNLDAVTGIAATANGIYAVEGKDTQQVEVWTINPTNCEATRRTHGFNPRNPQDLALSADGALWVLDIPDTATWLTFERVENPTGTSTAVPHRAAKPGPGALNATAMLLQADGTPVVIAVSSGKGILYRPDGALRPNDDQNLPVLTQVGEFVPINTGTPGSPIDLRLVSGAAVSPDRSRVVIRTKTDAYEYKVGSDGDIVKAITEGEPVITPLPGEENGQSITYSVDGKQFLTLSGGENPVLRSYTPFVPQPAAPPPNAGSGGGGGGLDFGDITMIAVGTGLLGAGAVVAGIIGIVRFRRQADDEDDYEYDRPRPPRPRGSGRRDDGPRRAPARPGHGGDGYGRDGYDDGYGHDGYGHDEYGRDGYGQDDYGRGRGEYGPSRDPGYGGAPPHVPGPQGGSVYGGGPSYAPQGGGSVYGGGQPHGPGQGGGAVYGGQPPGGGSVYGGGQQGSTYGRPRRPDPDEEPPRRRPPYDRDDEPTRRRPYGHDNIDL